MEALDWAKNLKKKIRCAREVALHPDIIRNCIRSTPLKIVVEGIHSLIAQYNRVDERACLLALVRVILADAAKKDLPESARLRFQKEWISWETLQDIYHLAYEKGDLALRGLLLPAAPQIVADKAEFRLPESIRELTLGERKARARGYQKDLLKVLMLDTDPAVVHILLQNPRITEDHVVRIMSRRPNKGEVLTAVVEQPKWLGNYRVQLTIALNPYAPPQMASAMTLFLIRPDLMQVSSSEHLHEAVRDVAEYLLKLRAGQA